MGVVAFLLGVTLPYVMPRADGSHLTAEQHREEPRDG